MQTGVGDKIAAWTAASLAAVWASLLVPLTGSGGLAIVAFPLALGVMVVVGLPLAWIAKRLDWTGWAASGAAGALAGLAPVLFILAGTRDLRFGENWLPALALFILPGAAGGMAFRAVLGRYRVVGAKAEVEPAGYDYRPSPWPAAALLLGLSAAALVFAFAARF